MSKLEAKNWTVQGDLLVSFFSAGSIPAELWEDYCDTIASSEVHKVLATSIGAVAVDSAQRRRVNEALKSTPQAAVAVVTDEAIVRGLMTATAWLGRVDVKAFPWHKVSDAYRHLSPVGISESETLDLVDAVRRRVEEADAGAREEAGQ